MRPSVLSGAAAGRVAVLSVLWVFVHSALASRRVKAFSRRFVGQRYHDGLYRLAYNAQSVALLACGALWFVRLPDRELYGTTPPLSWFLRAGQVASLGVLLSGVRVMGIPAFAGLASLWNLLKGEEVHPPPEAQGPPVGADGQIVDTGAFRFTRHPGNLGALGFFLFLPRMTVNRAVLTALVALYVVLGSMHEERRLRAAYGSVYERYRRSVPFLLPRPRRG